jgi:tetratricopeptide (TPR) repeat protein
MKLKWMLLPVVCASLAIGCASDKKKAQPTKTANAQWNRARANVMLGLAKDQYATGNFDPSRKTVDEALQLDPDNGPLRLLSARLAIEGGQLDRADKDLERARAANPKDAEADYLSGVVYQRWQKPDVALKYYSNACDKDQGELAYILAKSEMLLVLDREEEALRLLQEKVTYFENSAVIRDAVGQLLVRYGKYDDACDVLRQASILASDDSSIQEHLALAQFFAEKYPEAVDTFQRVLKKDGYSKRGDLYLALGRCQLELGKNREARESLERAAQLDDTSPGVWVTLGRAAMQLNDFKRAELSLRKAVALDPENSEVRLMVGYLRLRQHKYDEALAAFQKSSSLDRGDTVSLCMIGYTLKKLGRDEEASRYYSQALKIKPGDAMARKLMAAVDLKE